MKKKSRLLKIFFPLLLSAVLFTTGNIYAQNGDKQDKENARVEALKNAIESKRYVFTAQSATPMSGRTRQLTTEYILKVKNDTVTADLPYYGRAYQASYGDTEGGINFTTTQFEYSEKDGPKGGWDIIVTPKEAKNVQRMILNVSNSGYGTLQVTSNTRQMISFYGQVTAIK